MANETITSGIAFPASAYIDVMSNAFVKKSVLAPLVRGLNIPEGTMTVSLGKDGFVGASTAPVSEGANYTTLQQYQTTKVDLSIVKDVSAAFISVEARDMLGVDEARLATKEGEALARRVDTAISALFTGIANGVGTGGSVITKDLILDAVYKIMTSTYGNVGQLVAVLSPKHVLDLTKELTNTTASAFTIPSNLTILGTPGSRQAAMNGYVGKLGPVEVFQSFGLPTANAAVDDVSCVFDPQLAFAAAVAPSPNVIVIPRGVGNPSFGVEVSSYLWHGEAEYNEEAACRITAKA